MTRYFTQNSNRLLQDHMIYKQGDLGLCVCRTYCFTKESRSLFHGIVILPNICYTVGYLNKVLCSYESVGLNVQAKHKNRSPWSILHGSIVCHISSRALDL